MPLLGMDLYELFYELKSWLFEKVMYDPTFNPLDESTLKMLAIELAIRGLVLAWTRLHAR